MLDNNFALACCMLMGRVLGYPVLEEQNKDMLLAWLEGDHTIKLSQLRTLGYEIVGERFKRFSDMIDLDRLVAQE